MAVAETIVCVECGGRCGLLLPLDPEAPPEAGDVLAYRCADCDERWDVVVADDDVSAEGDPRDAGRGG